MSIKVMIPTPLQKLTNGQVEVACSAANIRELVDALEKEYPGIKERLSDGGKIRRFINIYVNEEDIRFVNKEETTLKDGDNVSIVPAIAGGSGRSAVGGIIARSSAATNAKCKG
jgi:molybdopterin synthase sulfur carrier subunit